MKRHHFFSLPEDSLAGSVRIGISLLCSTRAIEEGMLKYAILFPSLTFLSFVYCAKVTIAMVTCWFTSNPVYTKWRCSPRSQAFNVDLQLPQVIWGAHSLS